MPAYVIRKPPREDVADDRTVVTGEVTPDRSSSEIDYETIGTFAEP